LSGIRIMPSSLVLANMGGTDPAPSFRRDYISVRRAHLPQEMARSAALPRKDHLSVEVAPHRAVLLRARRDTERIFMTGMAATSIRARIAKAGGRFLAEIAVSSIATLCVSLGLSNYLTRESPAALPSSPPAFTLVS